MFFVEGWIIYPDVKGFFYGSSKVLVFPPYYAEVDNVNFMAWSDGASVKA